MKINVKVTTDAMIRALRVALLDVRQDAADKARDTRNSTRKDKRDVTS